MDLQSISLSAAGRLRGSSPSSPSRRSLKQKLEDRKTDAVATVPVYGGEADGGTVVAAVGAGDEVSSLQEAVASHKEMTHQLLEELEEERNAAATAASETMAMILRLQREKAEIQMEARNYWRFAEEKMAHDQDELDNLEDLLFKRDEAIHYLTFQVEAYRHSLLRHSIDPDAISVTAFDVYDDPPEFDDVLVDDYPPLKFTVPDHGGHIDEEEQMYAFLAAPAKGKTDNWESAEASSVGSLIMEKGIVGQSPENSPRNGLGPEKEKDEIPVTMDLPSDSEGGDDVTDRVCMIDTIDRIRTAQVSESSSHSPKEKKRKGEVNEEEEEQEGNVDIKKLYLWLQALEEDRELMRQAIVSKRSEKAQLMLLQEMAQQLKEDALQKKKKMMMMMMKKPLHMTFSRVFISIVKWIAQFLFGRRQASRTKYSFGISSNNVGLMLVIDKSPEITYCRCLIRDTTITETSFLNNAPPCSRTKSPYYNNTASG